MNKTPLCHSERTTPTCHSERSPFCHSERSRGIFAALAACAFGRIYEMSPRASLGRHDKGRRGDGRNDNESINLKN